MISRRSIRLLSAFVLVGSSALDTVTSAATSGEDPAWVGPGERVELVLEPASLPAGDRQRSRDRIEAIAESIASSLPLFRSFDPRAVLADSLAVLADHGVDLADAILNFDSVEATVPADARAAIEVLPWIREVRHAVVATSSGRLDSEGLDLIGSRLANLSGIRGSGITVAIIDDGFNQLNRAVADPHDELVPIAIAKQHRVNRAASSTVNVTLDGKATQSLEGEHGTACAEVVYEVAPGVDFLLLGFDPQGVNTQYEGGVTSAQIQFAIRKAADLGADVILIPMFIMATMSDPNGVLTGGTNAFTDDVDYAVALRATVVVSAGNEDLRTVEETFAPCADCVREPAGICELAVNDTTYHTWDPMGDFLGPLPLNNLIFGDEVDEAEVVEHLTCYTATDAATPSDFEIRMFQYFDPNFDCDPLCPNDGCMSLVGGTARNLNQGFSLKNKAIYDSNGDEYQYFLTVRRKSGAATPKIRVACTTAVAQLEWSTPTGRSLSDLAVLTNAISVGAVDTFGDPICDLDFTGTCSSRGPTGLAGGPVKPDLVGPSFVTNFTVSSYGHSAYSDFVGSSAAAAHVAGLVALLQSKALADTGTMLTPAAVRSALLRAAIPLATNAEEELQFGAGFAHIPEPAPGPYRMTALAPCRMFDSRTMPGPDGGAPRKLEGGVERVIPATGVCGIPTTARAVAGILTVVGPSQASFISLFPGDSIRPLAAAMTFTGGQVLSNNAMVKLADNDTGTMRAFLANGTADFVFDATAYFQ
jgi:subtilisin family serine protease